MPIGSYADYLSLSQVLGAQHPVSEEHDEMLFIVIHQATELWLKLVIHELEVAEKDLSGNELGPAFKALARVSRIQHVLIESWAVLATMTPVDYLRFRGMLGTASGFQSQQYRAVEFILGRRDRRYLDVFDGSERTWLESILMRPSLYDEALRLLTRRGLLSHTERDWSIQHEPSDEVVDAWTAVYRNPDDHWELYELAEKLVDLEHAFSAWRFEHYSTVHRIIGNKPGTGGTSGLGYLKEALDFTFFPELWEVRTRL